MSLEAIKYQKGDLEILNQLLLPTNHQYEKVININDGWNAIRNMKVRGAPAIAIVGCLSLAVDIQSRKFNDVEDFHRFVSESLIFLSTARPTAVNMGKSASYLIELSQKLVNENCDLEKAIKVICETIESMMQTDINDNKKLGKFGAQHIIEHCGKQNNSGDNGLNVLTHCNAGALATAGYGTAVGVIRSLHEEKVLSHVYCTETRPYNQGARLTAYELVYDKLPSTLICDSMVALLMKTKQISAVIVGADRVAKNGDTANKIGTYQIAITAKHHGVPFYVAAPLTCHDDNIENGESIVIEMRPEHEMTSIANVQIAAPGINCWNPAFDVTPWELITGGIITEYGVFRPNEMQQNLKKICKNEEQ